jgi:hypothetical protein
MNLIGAYHAENALWVIGAMHPHICTLDGHWDLPSTNVSVKYILFDK